MNSDIIFRVLVLLLFIGMQHLRRHLRDQVGWKASWPAMKRHPRDTIALLSVTTSWLVAVVVYVAFPACLAAWIVPLPNWIRWCALGSAIAAMALIGWSDRCLGKNLSVTLRIRENHTLITDGPYRRIRHPIYTGALLYAASLSTMTANYVTAALFMIPMTVLVAQRMRREEQMMINEFGEEYRAFMTRTGRLLPKWHGKGPIG